MAVHRPVAAAALAVVSILLAGCSALGGAGDASTPIPTGPPQIDVLSLTVGDCLATDDARVSATVPVVDCSAEHDSEAYESIPVPGDDFPGDEAITAQAQKGCAEAFSTFAGIAYDDSSLDYAYYFPTAGSWDAGDRRILCLIMDPGTRVTGTLEGAAR